MLLEQFILNTKTRLSTNVNTSTNLKAHKKVMVDDDITIVIKPI